jgi:hypothetical protein
MCSPPSMLCSAKRKIDLRRKAETTVRGTVHRLLGAGTRPGKYRHLWRDVIRGKPADARDRRPYGDGRPPARCVETGDRSGREIDRYWFGSRPGHCIYRIQAYYQFALSGQFSRSIDVSVGRCASGGSGFAGLLHPGATRNESRSDDRITN